MEAFKNQKQEAKLKKLIKKMKKSLPIYTKTLAKELRKNNR